MTSDPFDPARLRSAGDAGQVAPDRPRRRPPRHRPGERFLKGPIPWPWLAAAAALPGRALAVGLVVWFEAGCAGTRTVGVTLGRLTCLRMSPDTARRGLRALEAAGLVSVGRRPGRALTVTLNDPPGPETGGTVGRGTDRDDNGG